MMDNAKWRDDQRRSRVMTYEVIFKILLKIKKTPIADEVSKHTRKCIFKKPQVYFKMHYYCTNPIQFVLFSLQKAISKCIIFVLTLFNLCCFPCRKKSKPRSKWRRRNLKMPSLFSKCRCSGNVAKYMIFCGCIRVASPM